MARSIFDSPFPICLWSGPQYALVYNDAYRRILAAKHPAALGQPGSIVWAEIWEELQPQFDGVRAGGNPLYFEDAPFVMARLEGGGTETAWFSYSLSALRDEGGGVAAVLNITPETTDRVLLGRRLAEEQAALANSEAAARVDAQRVHLALAAGAIIGTWFWDISADHFTADEPFARAFGLEPVQCREGIPLADIFATVHPDDQAGLANAIEAATVKGGPYAHKYRVRRADGRYYWIEANGRVDLGPDGKAVSFPGVLIDVEERRAVEGERDRAIGALRDLNADLERRVVERTRERGRTWEVSPDLHCVFENDGRFSAVNPAWTATLGWTQDELVGALYTELLHPEDAELTTKTLEALQHDLPVLGHANRYRTRDGGWRWLSWVAVPVDGRFYCSARDVTDENAQAAELAARTAERDRLWNLSQDMLARADYTGMMSAVSPAWTRVLGWTEHVLLTRGYASFMHPDDEPPTLEAIGRMAETGQPARFENRISTSEGSWKHIEWTVAPEPDGANFIAVGRDISYAKARDAELELAQEALRQSQKMEAVGQLTGGLAHDFNNLLTGMMGNLELLQGRVARGRLEDADRFINAAQGAGQRAASLTQRLLAFSRRQTLDPRPTDVNRLIAGIEELLRRTVGGTTQIEVVGAGGLWAANIDAGQLENAMLNLCINARDAMPDGGRITTETANKWMDERAGKERELAPGQYLSICVTDTGCGMSAETISRAFEPFYTTKPIGQGTGLGLSMIYGFARQSGGQVRIYSEVGQGTTVCVYLPRHVGEAEHADTVETVRTLQTATGQTVLVVDDEPTIRHLIDEVLDEAGYTVINVADGASGLRVLEAGAQIELLITDVGLPNGMNGRQVADAALALRPGLKVLFITGYAENAAVGNGHLEAGMELLTKPFSMAALATKVADMMRAKTVA